MKSKTSYFSPTLFKKNISRFWPLWAGYLIVWFFVLVPPFFNSNQYNPAHNSATLGVVSSGVTGGLILGFAFGGIASLAIWSFLYSARSVSFMTSLPLKREGIFITSYLSALVTFVGANILLFLITLISEVIVGAVEIRALLLWFGVVNMSGICFLGIGSLTAMLTGNIVAMPILYVIINFIFYAGELLVKSLMSTFLHGASGGFLSFWNSITKPLSPLVYMSSETGPRYEYLSQTNPQEFAKTGQELISSYWIEGFHVFIIYSIVGLVLAGLALLLFKRRRMETASDVIAIPVMRPIFRYVAAFFGATGFTCFVFSLTGSFKLRPLSFTLLLLIGLFLGYFAAEMLINKSFKVWKGKWLGFGISCAVAVCCVVLMATDAFGFERSLPDIDKIESASFYGTRPHGELKEAESINNVLDVHKSLISKRKDNEYRYLPDIYDYVNIAYTMKNGKTFVRSYGIPSNQDYPGVREDIELMNKALNSKEAISNRISAPVPIDVNSITHCHVGYSIYNEEHDFLDREGLSLSSPEAAELYETCIVPDVRDGNLGFTYFDSQNYNDYFMACEINIEVGYTVDENGEKIHSSHSLVIPVTVDSKRTNAWLEERGVELMTSQEAQDIEYRDYYPPNIPTSTSDIRTKEQYPEASGTWPVG